METIADLLLRVVEERFIPLKIGGLVLPRSGVLGQGPRRVGDR